MKNACCANHVYHMFMVDMTNRQPPLFGLSGENSIGFLRLILAYLVLVGHSFSYGGFGEDPLLSLSRDQVAIGRFPVDVFFAFSGYLISQSWDKSSSAQEFLWHRFLRIYPAFLVCIAFTGIFVAKYFTGSVDISYLLNNFPLIFGTDQSIDGLFAGNPGGSLVNGSLWTLPWELRAYCLLLIFGIFGGLRSHKISIFSFVACWAIFVAQIIIHNEVGDKTVITSWYRLMTFFFAGMVIFSSRGKIRFRARTAWVSLFILIFSSWMSPTVWLNSGGLFYVLAPVLLTYFSFWLATTGVFKQINQRYDYSYGVYIYGSVVLQCLASLHLNDNYWTYLGLASLVTAVLSSLSWYVVEKPALNLKHLVGCSRRGSSKPQVDIECK